MKIFSKIIVIIDFFPRRERIKDTTKIGTLANFRGIM